MVDQVQHVRATDDAGEQIARQVGQADRAQQLAEQRAAEQQEADRGHRWQRAVALRRRERGSEHHREHHAERQRLRQARREAALAMDRRAAHASVPSGSSESRPGSGSPASSSPARRSARRKVRGPSILPTSTATTASASTLLAAALWKESAIATAHASVISPIASMPSPTSGPAGRAAFEHSASSAPRTSSIRKRAPRPSGISSQSAGASRRLTRAPASTASGRSTADSVGRSMRTSSRRREDRQPSVSPSENAALMPESPSSAAT